MRSWNRLGMAALVALFLAGDARADGVDIVPYLTRVGGGGSVFRVVASVILLMLVNYALNFLVVGWPALRYGTAGRGLVARGLVWFTILGQVADRLGAILAGLAAGLVSELPAFRGEGGWVIPLLAFNFIFSGLAVAVLSLWFLRRRWGVPRLPRFAVAAIAGVITNPAWMLLYLFFWSW